MVRGRSDPEHAVGRANHKPFLPVCQTDAAGRHTEQAIGRTPIASLRTHRHMAIELYAEYLRAISPKTIEYSCLD